MLTVDCKDVLPIKNELLVYVSDQVAAIPTLKNNQFTLSTFDDDEIISQDKKIWQIHNKYIITELTSGIVIIDQHVAHERILYEQAKSAIDGEGLPSQTLLFPETIKFSHEEYLLFPEVLPWFSISE